MMEMNKRAITAVIEELINRNATPQTADEIKAAWWGVHYATIYAIMDAHSELFPAEFFGRIQTLAERN